MYYPSSHKFIVCLSYIQIESHDTNDIHRSDRSATNHRYEEPIEAPPSPYLNYQHSQSLSPIYNRKFLYLSQNVWFEVYSILLFPQYNISTTANDLL